VIKVSRSRSSELGYRARGQRHLIYKRLLLGARRFQSPERSFRGFAFLLSIARLSGCPRAYLESIESLNTARQSWHAGISDQGAPDKAFKQKMWPAQFFHFVEAIKWVVNTLDHTALETTLFLYAIFSLLLLNQSFRVQT
jgi:hypothetical protein